MFRVSGRTLINKYIVYTPEIILLQAILLVLSSGTNWQSPFILNFENDKLYF